MDVTFMFSFGDGPPALHGKGAKHQVYPGAWFSRYHRFTQEGTFIIRVTAYNEFYNATEVQCSFNVEKMPANLHLTANSSLIHKDEVILFNAHLVQGTNATYTWNMGDQTTYVNGGSVVSHLFLAVAVYNVSVTAQNRVGSVTASTSISVLYRIQAVGIYTDKRVYATDTAVTFLAVTPEPGPLEFLWYFGDKPPQRTTSKSITKRYYVPGSYNVIVNASNGLSSFTSDIYAIVIQREVQSNRLVFDASVMLNTSVTFNCRINRGTNVTYHWSFGDGTNRIGRNTEQHVFHRTGEFTVEVTVSNLVSSASLMGQVFVVRQPCQPPPIKNMGPLKIQVRRYQTLRLGVTYEGDVQCNISQGLLYSWALYESGGLRVQLTPVETHQQNIELPNNFLHYGTYTAIAKVQIQGSIVYSNYTVRIEVVPSPPISLIYGGTNIFISNRNSTILTLNGQRSYDPDYPQSVLSFIWKCKPVSIIRSPCFDENIPTSSSVITFPVSSLKPRFDQFQFTLTVQSGDRTSTSEVFITISPKLNRKVQAFCYQCQGNTVNWNEQFSVEAHCESCGIPPINIFYTWKLFLVNASSKVIVEVPFCKNVELSLPSRIFDGPSFVPLPELTLPLETTSQTPGISSTVTVRPSAAILTAPQTPPRVSTLPAFPETPEISEHPGPQNHSGTVTSSNTTSNTMVPKPATVPALPTRPFIPLFPPFPAFFPEENQPLGGRARQRRSVEPQGPDSAHVHLAESAADSGPLPAVPGDYSIPLPPYYVSEYTVSPDDDIITEFPIDSDFPPIFESSSPIGRPGAGSGSSSGGDVITGSSGGEGHNLVDPSTLLLTRPEKTLLDLDRELIDSAVFQTLVFTGISSPVVTFKPFVLKAKSLYMLEVSADSEQALLGKTQLFFSTNEIPQGMICQVQPSKGYEIHTDFSIFCTSGKEDLLYEYSFSIGNTPRKILYQGRDFQYYFNLPSGDPDDDYKVTVYTEIRNRFGSGTKPCPVSVKVLPIFQRNAPSVHNSEIELYVHGLRNLTKLVQMGSYVEIRNYILLLTSVLNRLSQESTASTELQTDTRSALISAACDLTIKDEGTLVDNIDMLKELMSVTEQVSFLSARLVTRRIQDMSARFGAPSMPLTYIMDERMINALVSLLSHVLEAQLSSPAGGVQLISDSIRTTAHLLLKYVLFNKVSEHNVSTSLMELKTSQYSSFQNIANSVGSCTFYLPHVLGLHINGWSGTTHSTNPRNSCVVSQLMFFKQNPYFRGNAPAQIKGNVADLKLYNCTTRREIRARSLSAPVNIEFQKRDRNESNCFSLLRSHMNIHQFNVTPENLREALQITIEFTRPTRRTFPIMLLFRMFERPTPSLYNTQRIYGWEGNTVHIFLPPSSLNDAGTGYLALLNADYSRSPWNKYISNAVNYTLRIESTQCLSWDGREWKTDGCTPLEGMSSDKVNCSCNHLATFTVAYQEIQSHHEFTDVSQFTGFFDNPMLCSVIAISLAVYFLVMIACKWSDIQRDKMAGSVLLEDNSPSDRQLYAVTIDTGLRSRPTMTAKVHIVLHGEGGASQTRELSFSDQLLFDRNSRHTFILSTPDNLGPIWKLHLWHTNGGPSPSWYLSHVVVRDLTRGGSWFFPGECWLAVDEGDGRVERELTPLTQGLGFTKLLHLKLTEYLEDFHSWASVYSRPSHSRFTRVQRLSVCLLLLEGYMCANAALVSLQNDQYTAELGLIDVSTVSLATGILSTLAVLPVGGLVSLLFRLCKASGNKYCSRQQYKTRIPEIYSVEAHRDALLVDGSISESYLSCHSLQECTQEKWRMQCKRGVVERRSPSQASMRYRELHMEKQGQATAWNSSGGFEDGSSNSKPMDKDCKQSQHNLQSGCTAEHSCVLGQREHRSSRVVLPSWCRHVTWALCSSLTLVCIVITGGLGLRFSPTKSLLWIHSLFFSMLCCVFVVQPALILIIATAVSLWYKDRCDFYCCSDETETAGGLQEHWSHNGGRLSEIYPLSLHQHPQNQYTHFDRVLAARQRARHLRLTRPPTPADLKDTRDRMKKELLIRKILREAILYTFMLSLLLFITYGKSSESQYQLNQAVRAEFTKNPRSIFHAIKTHNDWWNWSLTALLEGLYWDTWYNKASTNTKAGAVQGTCILIGEPTLKKMEVEKKIVCKVPRSSKGLVPECLPAHSPGERVLGQPEPSTDPALSGSHRHCGHVACYEGAGTRVSLGPTRAEASVRLQELWDRGWLDRYTQAVMVQFTLYNPPTNLFTSVSLLTEQPSAGGLLPFTFIESIRVYQTAGPLHYAIMACELLFLLLILLHLYLQIFTMSQKGLLAYWRDIRNWLEVTIIIISLLYYICYVNHFILAVEIIDLWQRENFKSFVDLGFLSSWEQLTRCLHGLMLFLLLLRCVFLLQTNRTMAPSVTLLKLSFRKLLWPLVAGVILAIAFASLGNVLFLSSSCHFSGLIRSFQTVITHCLGISQLKAPSALYQPNNGSVTLLCGSFLFSVSIVWTALITGILTSLAKTAKKTLSRKYLVTFSEVAAYTQDRLLVFLGKRKENWRDNHTQRSHFYFDEFENLVDELLFRVNALSNSLHHTLPCGEQGYREGYSPPMSHSEYIYSLNSQRAISREDRMRSSVGKSTSEMEEMISKNNPDIYRLLLPSGDDSSYENNFRTKLELEALCHLQQSQHSNRTSSGGSVVSSGPLHTERPEGVSTWAIPESSAVLPGSIEAPETPNGTSPRSDHYNLAQLGDDLPHVLCGARCPEKQTALSGTLESQVSRSTTDLMAKNRKLLRRSHATVIRPLGGGRDGAVSQENLEAGSTLCSDPEPSSLKAAFWTEEPTA
ncbi:polycystic kidney disease 1 like 1 [Anguilla anguilla]|uniref:polycystic kidney disease 1 like 1 n=1 Tax=Anguilla anguilla TaxID=7936 RepID=UPI0015B2287C|nr:polycystic kidney disease 1 like 1 [Anguilla anguilla]